jgi:Spy/CpxP family protein refolding chaperone
MFQRLATTGLALSMLAGALFAQEQDTPRRGNRDGGNFRMQDRNSYLGLLRMDVVKEDLKITDAQQAEIDRIAEEARNAPRGEFTFNRDASEEERAQQFAAMREAAAARENEIRTKLAGVLDETQNARLLGIWVQRAGTEALSNEEVAAKLELTDEQKQQLATIREEQRQAFRPRGDRPQPAEGDRPAPEGDRPRGDGENPFARFAEQRRQNEEKIMAVLTDEQKAKLDEIKGAAIEFPQPQFGNRDRGPGGEDGDRPRGFGRRPDGDNPSSDSDSDRPRRPASDE